MLVLVAVQFQRAGERVGDGWAGAGLLAALEPGVVIDAYPGQRGDLLPAQPGSTAHPGAGGEADVSRATACINMQVTLAIVPWMLMMAGTPTT